MDKKERYRERKACALEIGETKKEARGCTLGGESVDGIRKA